MIITFYNRFSRAFFTRIRVERPCLSSKSKLLDDGDCHERKIRNLRYFSHSTFSLSRLVFLLFWLDFSIEKEEYFFIAKCFFVRLYLCLRRSISCWRLLWPWKFLQCYTKNMEFIKRRERENWMSEMMMAKRESTRKERKENSSKIKKTNSEFWSLIAFHLTFFASSLAFIIIFAHRTPTIFSSIERGATTHTTHQQMKVLSPFLRFSRSLYTQFPPFSLMSICASALLHRHPTNNDKLARGEERNWGRKKIEMGKVVKLISENIIFN